MYVIAEFGYENDIMIEAINAEHEELCFGNKKECISPRQPKPIDKVSKEYTFTC